MKTTEACVYFVNETLFTPITAHLHVFEVLVYKLHVVITAGTEP